MPSSSTGAACYRAEHEFFVPGIDYCFHLKYLSFFYIFLFKLSFDLFSRALRGVTDNRFQAAVIKRIDNSCTGNLVFFLNRHHFLI